MDHAQEKVNQMRASKELEKNKKKAEMQNDKKKLDDWQKNVAIKTLNKRK
jgi:hypothetical protein